MKTASILALIAVLACSATTAFADDMATSMSPDKAIAAPAMDKDKMMQKDDMMKKDAMAKKDSTKKEAVDKSTNKTDSMSKDGMAPTDTMSK